MLVITVEKRDRGNFKSIAAVDESEGVDTSVYHFQSYGLDLGKNLLNAAQLAVGKYLDLDAAVGALLYQFGELESTHVGRMPIIANVSQLDRPDLCLTAAEQQSNHKNRQNRAKQRLLHNYLLLAFRFKILL